jgi:hypothetical protein
MSKQFIIKQTGIILFGFMFATAIALIGNLWNRYAPINNFIVIDEFVLTDSVNMQIGYTTRNTEKHLLADYHYKYACKNDSGSYVASPDWQIVHKGIQLSSTKGELKRIDFEFNYPDGISGECKAETNIYIHIGSIERYYGQFTNYFKITN